MAQFMLNHYEQAIPEFEAGFAEEPEAAFLFNLAQSHARLHHTKEALDFYRKYLDLGAPPEDVAVVNERIAELEAEAAAPPAPVTPPPAPVAAPAPVRAPAPAVDLSAPPPPKPKKMPIVIGVVAAAVALAVVLGLFVGLSTQPGEPSLSWSAH